MTEGHQEPRSGRFSESEIVRKKESSRSNLIEREVGKEKEQPAEQQEVAYNSTSEEEEVVEDEGWLGSRKSSKSVASSSFSNSVLGGAEKDSLDIIENHILKSQERRRRSTVERESNDRTARGFDIRRHQDDAGCTQGPTVMVSTRMGLTNLSFDYCLGCSSTRGHNCSYLVPLSAHMPDPNISLLIPTSSVLCPSADTIPGICPAVNDISAQEDLGEDLGGIVPPQPHSGLMAHVVDVRTHSWMRLTWRLPLGNDNNGLASSICTLPSSDLGKMFTQINVEVRRMCQSEL